MAAVRGMDEAELRKRITQIHLDPTLSEQEKAKKRQELLSGQWAKPSATDEPEASTGVIDRDERHDSVSTLYVHITNANQHLK